MSPYNVPQPVYASHRSRPQFTAVIWMVCLCCLAVVLWIVAISMAMRFVSWEPETRHVNCVLASAITTSVVCVALLVRYQVQRANAEDHAALLAVISGGLDQINQRLDTLAGKIATDHETFAEAFELGAESAPSVGNGEVTPMRHRTRQQGRRD